MSKLIDWIAMVFRSKRVDGKIYCRKHNLEACYTCLGVKP